MAVWVEGTEIGSLAYVKWTCDTTGDVVANLIGLEFEHPTTLTHGKVDYELDGVSQGVFDAVNGPIVFDIPLNKPYKFTSLDGPGTIICIYNKLEPGAFESVKNLFVGAPFLWAK